ncbi:D-alanyl-D-alanine carboxypeptidase/D-alanyl-D-alanine endopeptidase [Paenarthrobacter ureafaciens]|uniref:D-alanyl-D-alanine carboxypeptidase/D-alanyl-D-alanine endopeptidase n=1 Tax=Paenarthrobacter ureafaciens TaxID=37931 RepID=UPI002DBA4F2E|nr:D-alanyl-D-alanine carboxypeptidase/D-alanyl-D-alanine-endopeptidase [Paenarthrobacter ureafaciens]MEC3851493.1 D-alanyl-D-alanine carboxypeptidase/D-alanyl-D-alanine-endopeptidase [Paenarthrobacter ureafaciens]
MKGVENGAARRGLSAAWGRLKWPLLLAVVLLCAAVLIGSGLAPGLWNAPKPPPPVPAWQQQPTSLATTKSVLPLDKDAPKPTKAELTRLLETTLQPDGEGSMTGVVLDAATGEVLFDRQADASRIPASNMKLLTAVAALKALGPDTRLTTRVVGADDPATVVLTGGGDVLLGAGESDPSAVMGRAGLASLAADTASALAASKVTGPVTVKVDDSLFSGPALNPAWSLDDVAAGETAPLYPLALNSGRYSPTVTTGPRPQDSAATTAQAFAEQLAAAGVKVAPGVERGKGVPGRVLASAESATVSEQVDLMLEVSDNFLAEALGRLTAAASRQEPTYDGATAAVRQRLGELGITTDSMELADVSGLALENKVSARQFAEVVRAITSGSELSLRAALDGFPVAGLTGTLDDRYIDAGTSEGAGLVRAKTGTLNTVIALSGYVVDADGRLLVFSFIGNGLEPGAAGNKVAMDRSASVLASCGCR